MNVQKANIIYHTILAEKYDQTQPQFKPENVSRVTERLKNYAKKYGNKRLLDLGCGTGFIPIIAYPFFEEVYGIDITLAMLKKVKEKIEEKNIILVRGLSDNLPFPDLFFDVVSSYGFLHHLSSLSSTFKEVYRVLKKGGLFYSDLEPNHYFWKSMKNLSNDNLSEILKTEKESVCSIYKNQYIQYIDKNIFETAEFFKTHGGFIENDIKKILQRVGFKNVSFEYTWFWQQGKVIKDLSVETANYFENHLRLALPVTKNYFKYLRFEATK